jgi:hypothetical protein
MFTDRGVRSSLSSKASDFGRHLSPGHPTQCQGGIRRHTSSSSRILGSSAYSLPNSSGLPLTEGEPYVDIC